MPKQLIEFLSHPRVRRLVLPYPEENELTLDLHPRDAHERYKMPLKARNRFRGGDNAIARFLRAKGLTVDRVGKNLHVRAVLSADRRNLTDSEKLLAAVAAHVRENGKKLQNGSFALAVNPTAGSDFR